MFIIRKLGALFLWVNKFLWLLFPNSFHQSRPGLAWGRFIFFLVNLKNDHIQLTTTYFLRNRAELAQFGQIISEMPGPLNIAVIGCSEGAEVYSIIMTANKAMPELKINIEAFDINESALNIAKRSRYPSDSRLFKYVHHDEISESFISDNDWLIVKPEFREKVNWNLGDPTQEPLLSSIPKHDILFINRLLFHMSPEEAERCLSAAANLVRPGGYLFVSGVDLDLRTRLARAGKWRPITDHIEEIHAGDETMTLDWPFERWGLEPIDKNHRDWPLRYCSIFQIP